MVRPEDHRRAGSTPDGDGLCRPAKIPFIAGGQRPAPLLTRLVTVIPSQY